MKPYLVFCSTCGQMEMITLEEGHCVCTYCNICNQQVTIFDLTNLEI